MSPTLAAFHLAKCGFAFDIAIAALALCLCNLRSLTSVRRKRESHTSLVDSKELKLSSGSLPATGTFRCILNASNACNIAASSTTSPPFPLAKYRAGSKSSSTCQPLKAFGHGSLVSPEKELHVFGSQLLHGDIIIVDCRRNHVGLLLLKQDHARLDRVFDAQTRDNAGTLLADTMATIG